MIIDGTNVIDFGVVVEDRNPSRSAAATSQVLAGSPGAWRRVRLGRDAPEALGIHVIGSVIGDDISDLQDNIDRLKWEMRPDREFALRWSDTSDREWYGYRTTLVVNDIKPGWLTRGVSFNLKIVCPDPFARELSLQDESTSGSAPLTLTMPNGTAPMPVVITIQGHASTLINPVLHYRDGSDTDIITISYAGSLNVSQTLVIDTEHFTAKVNGSNVGGDISGSYFDVNPGDGDKYAGSPTYPDIRLTADSGAATDFQIEYKRRYW